MTNFPLSTLRPYIDWSPFFHSWEIKGKFPELLSSPVVGKEAQSLFDDANEMLDQVIDQRLLQAKAVCGVFPANAVGDDIHVYTNEQRDEVRCVFHTLRQQTEKRQGINNLALADFIAPADLGKGDYIGGFAVTAGIGIEKLVHQYEQDHDDYRSIMIKALADRFAEAFAECLHEIIRKEYWGYASEEQLQNDDLIRERYRGIRPAPGYPACPDHTEKHTLFELLQVEQSIGIKLTESCAMYPAASVSGLYFASPHSKYFGLGRIERDQVEDYALRKKETVEFVEQWLSPNLNYEKQVKKKVNSAIANQQVVQ